MLILMAATACSTGTSGATSSLVDPTATSTVNAPSTTVSPATSTSSTASISTTIVERSLSGRTVVIDPGHNGMNRTHPEEINRLVDVGNGTKACNTTGTATSGGYTEPEFTWAVARLVVDLLETEGATVILTRLDNDGWGPCIDERAEIGNRNGADAVISIHADGGPEEGRGFHVIHPAYLPGLTDDIYEDSLKLARILHDAYQATSMPVADYIAVDGYSERDDLGGLNLSDVPAVFLEAGNMRNETDAALLTDPVFQGDAARAIVEALVAYLQGGNG
jgi:N-acetylmuramoyl-L-alanine amidase